ncbi:MAG: hypothetical protein HQ513_13495 [Rhodospirillales bacterium]|nr:hypothetical protein [Rhodospirillales bacterium]
MTNIANDLHIEGRIANDLRQASDQMISRHPAAMMAAARAARSRELARLFGKAVRAISGLFGSPTKPVETLERTPANSNKIENHHLAA